MRRSCGFTLLEVLIALTLLSMMMVAVVAAMRTLGETSNAVNRVTDRVGEVRLISDFLRRSIEGTLPVLRVGTPEDSTGLPGSTGDAFFVGNETQLIWVAPLVAGANVGGAYVMHLQAVDGRLQLSMYPYEREYAAFESAELEPRVLVSTLSEFSIGYRATPYSDWLDTWPGQRYIPAAVRLNIRSGERYWPEIVVRLAGGEVDVL